MPKVVVVGAGIVGASVAYALTQRGAEVTVLEGQRPAAGTSSTSFAWTNANEKLPCEYFALNAAGLAEHHRLSAKLGGAWFHPTGNLEVATTPERQAYQQQKVERLCAWGYRAEVVDESRARELAPDLALPSVRSASYAFFPDEGWVSVPVLVHHLLEAAIRAGAVVVYPSRVTAIEVASQRLTGVATDAGSVAADVVIDCSGPSMGDLLAPLGLAIAQQRSRGLLIVTEPMPTCLERVVHTPNVHLRPDGGGRILCGAVDVDATLPDEGTVTAESDQCQELLRRAQAVLPTLAGARIEGVRLGWRPMPEDGLSAVGPIPGLTGYYIIFTHSGVTLGPILGQFVAEEVLTSNTRPELAPFRPARLVRA